MTKVRFTFVDVQGNPLPSMEFKLLLRRASFNVEDVGVALPEELEVVTDLQGQVIVDLWPLKAAYRIQVADEYAEVCAPMNWSFYVPQTDDIVEAQTLFLVPPPSNVPWDEEAIGKITQAVQDTDDNAKSAAASATAATNKAAEASASASAANTSKNAAATSAADALASKTAAAASQASASASASTATTKANEAKASELAAAASEASALASKNAAATSSTSAGNSATAAASSRDAAAASAVSANTSAGTATTKAAEASASAAAALASKNSAATSATEALASKNAAATSAGAAKTSETNAANSASSAATAGAAAGKTAAEAVVDGKQDKSNNLTRLSALVPSANAIVALNTTNDGFIARPVTDFVLAGQYGVGSLTTPALPASNANSQIPAGTYFTDSAWVGSIYPGTNSNNQGYLTVKPWSLLAYAKQQWSSINTPAGSFERYLVAGVWSDWFRVYTSATAIGLIANGGIIERGATANGQYTKYADGTLICWTDTLVASSRTATYMLAVWALPSPFMGTLPCVITVTARQNDPGTSDFPVAERGKGTLYGKLTSNSQAFVGFLTSSTNSFSVGTEIPLSAMAVGRWKA